jgi:hypothetical protein
VTEVFNAPMIRPLSSISPPGANAALYLRASTRDPGQDVENQRAQLQAFC